MPKFAILFILMVLCCAVTTSYSATIQVPSQQPTIQAGINAAVNGDTVLVAPGVYTENITFLGKAIRLASSGGAAVTTIQDATGADAVVRFVNGEGRGSIIDGFTVTGADHYGGIYCTEASPVIVNNIIVGNDSQGDGGDSGVAGGITIGNSTGAVIRGNVFIDNGGSNNNSAILLGGNGTFPTDDTISFNVFHSNRGLFNIRILGDLNRCRIYNNTLEVGSGGYGIVVQGRGLRDTVYITNNIVFSATIYAIAVDPDNPATFVGGYNCTFDNNVNYYGSAAGPGSIFSDALFQDRSNHDFRLSPNSPCIDTGDPSPVFNNPNGSRSEMGAYAYGRQPSSLHVPSEYSTIQAAVDSSIHGDTIIVAPGTYTGEGNFNINTRGKRIVVRSSHGPESTILFVDHQTELPDRGFDLSSGEDSLTIIEGFTVTSPSSGSSAREGGALRLVNASPKIVNCTFSRQWSGSGPGAAWVDYSSAIFENCSFKNNLAGNSAFLSRSPLIKPDVGGSGGAISAQFSQLTFRNCLFEGNGTDEGSGGAIRGESTILNFADCHFVGNGAHGDDNPGLGGAVHGDGIFVDCLFEGNSAQWSGGAVMGNCNFVRCTFVNNFTEREDVDGGGAFLGTGTFDSCTLVGNRADIGNAIVGTVTIAHSVIVYGIDKESENFPERVDDCIIGQATLSCSNIFGNSGGDWVGDIASQFGTNGNISSNPLFCDTAAGDFHIAAESPCAPAHNSCNQQIGAFGVACSVKPGVTAVGMANEVLTNVLSPTPTIQWAVNNPTSNPQDSFLIAVGTDNDWQFAEKWNPAPFASADTFVTYDGSALIDGQTYYLRLRVHNSLAWSDWYQTSFRMNSEPTAPAVRTPTNLAVTGSTPTLWITNGTDAQNDPLTYEFAGFHDTDCVAGPDISLLAVAQTADSTGGQITVPLAENCRYFWRARAYDGFEYSAWTPLAQFLVNGTPEAPTPPTLDFPPLPDNKPVFTLLPTLTWQPSYDPDPADTVRYKLELSDRANFSFALVRDSLLQTNLPLVDSLVFGTHYYWRVTARDKSSLTAQSSVKEFWTWKPGDMNHSHGVDLTDLSLLVAYLVQTPRPVILPKMVADLTSDCRIDLSDLSTLIAYMTTTGIVLHPGCE